MTITNLDSTFNGVYSSDVNGIQATKKMEADGTRACTSI
uniref:Uncharacterized protein n=1 Tax=Anguilla anguilla TaxID=7936 RepID=A0A0E9XTU4_ANGAN